MPDLEDRATQKRSERDAEKMTQVFSLVHRPLETEAHRKQHLRQKLFASHLASTSPQTLRQEAGSWLRRFGFYREKAGPTGSTCAEAADTVLAEDDDASSVSSGVVSLCATAQLLHVS